MRLIKLLTTKEQDLGPLVTEKMEKLGYKKVVARSKNNQYITFYPKGKRATYSVVAHLDTVSNADIAPLKYHIVSSTRITPAGNIEEIISLHDSAPSTVRCLGADDRLGVFVILQAIEQAITESETSATLPNVIFTYGEETGCIGSNAYATRFESHKDEFMLQFDRQNDDVVFYTTQNEDFQNLVSQVFNKEIAIGSTSDVRVFQNKYKVNSANVSVGYKRQHTRSETINMVTVRKTIDGLVNLILNKDLIEELGSFEWEEPAPVTYNYGYGYRSPATWGKSGVVDSDKVSIFDQDVISKAEERKMRIERSLEGNFNTFYKEPFAFVQVELKMPNIEDSGDMVEINLDEEHAITIMRDPQDYNKYTVLYWNGRLSDNGTTVVPVTTWMEKESSIPALKITRIMALQTVALLKEGTTFSELELLYEDWETGFVGAEIKGGN